MRESQDRDSVTRLDRREEGCVEGGEEQWLRSGYAQQVNGPQGAAGSWPRLEQTSVLL